MPRDQGRTSQFDNERITLRFIKDESDGIGILARSDYIAEIQELVRGADILQLHGEIALLGGIGKAQLDALDWVAAARPACRTGWHPLSKCASAKRSNQ